MGPTNPGGEWRQTTRKINEGIVDRSNGSADNVRVWWRNGHGVEGRRWGAQKACRGGSRWETGRRGTRTCRSRSESGGQVAALEGASRRSAAAFEGGGEAVALVEVGGCSLGG